jgi:hypothetical protein
VTPPGRADRRGTGAAHDLDGIANADDFVGELSTLSITAATPGVRSLARRAPT